MNIEQVKLSFEAWKGMENTMALKEAIEKHKKSFVDFISSNANTDMPSERLRYAANGIKTCDAIHLMMERPEVLLEKLGIKQTTQDNDTTK